MGAVSVVATLDMFKRGLRIIAPSFEKVRLAQEKIVLAGSAVTTCLLPWPEDIVELYENEGRQLTSIWNCLASLSLPAEILRKIDTFSQLSYNAKLAVNEALFDQFHDSRTPFCETDLDLFFITNDRRKVDLKSMMSINPIPWGDETWIDHIPGSDEFSDKPEKHIIRYRGRRGKISTRFRNKDARGWTYKKCNHDSWNYCRFLKNAPNRVTDCYGECKSNGSAIEGDGPIHMNSSEDGDSLHYEQARIPYHHNSRPGGRNLNLSIQALLEKQERKEPAKRMFKPIPDGAATNYEEFHAEITKPGDESECFCPLTFRHDERAKSLNVFQFPSSFEYSYC
ncbi:hypothetical protein BJ741DRAFT_669101 [Chytriomyces cf. hyalinus JEL632]|nr:hypothetical protein BJ741DRAFT_669101 [Chytriomyces cf. hyalinus JEL632]